MAETPAATSARSRKLAITSQERSHLQGAEGSRVIASMPAPRAERADADGCSRVIKSEARRLIRGEARRVQAGGVQRAGLPKTWVIAKLSRQGRGPRPRRQGKVMCMSPQQARGHLAFPRWMSPRRVDTDAHARLPAGARRGLAGARQSSRLESALGPRVCVVSVKIRLREASLPLWPDSAGIGIAWSHGCGGGGAGPHSQHPRSKVQPPCGPNPWRLRS